LPSPGIRAFAWPDVRCDVSASDRSSPGLMARRSYVRPATVRSRGPLPYQVSSAAWLTCAQPGRGACRVVASGRCASLSTAPSGTRRARASSSRTTGGPGRLVIGPASFGCSWPHEPVYVRCRCCTSVLYGSTGRRPSLTADGFKSIAVHGPPLLLSGLLAFPRSPPPKIIPRISRDSREGWLLRRPPA
jgi:hypothetical protein